MAMYPLKTLKSLNFFLLTVVTVVLTTPVVAVSLNELSSLDYQLRELSVKASVSTDADDETIEQSCTVTPEGRKLLNELLDDFKHYTIKPYTVLLRVPGGPELFHPHEPHQERKVLMKQEGTLYHHAIWTAHALENWFAEKNHWVENINPKDKNLTILAGLLHGIWHAGHHHNKQSPQAFLYLIESPMYFKLPGWLETTFGIDELYTSKNKAPFSFTTLRDALHISESDWFIIAATAALLPIFERQDIGAGYKSDIVGSMLNVYSDLFSAKFKVDPAAQERFDAIFEAVAAAHVLATRKVTLAAPPGDFEFSALESPPGEEKPTGDSLFKLLNIS